MSNTQYAVCHLQRGSGNDSGMTCHIERRNSEGKVYVPDNADSEMTHLNRELVTVPDGVRSRTEAIQYRIDHAGLHRKAAGDQTKAVRVILTGTHEQMMKLVKDGKLGRRIDASLLGSALVLAMGGPAQAHVGTGGGGSSSELPWREKKNKYSLKR